jgi:hypothetical protein
MLNPDTGKGWDGECHFRTVVTRGCDRCGADIWYNENEFRQVCQELCEHEASSAECRFYTPVDANLRWQLAC